MLRALALMLLLSPLLLADGAPAFGQSIGPAGGAWSGPPGAPAPGPYAPYEQPPARGGGRMDGEAAAQMLRARGFSNVNVLRQRGATILLEANGPRGERVQVVVDSASGAISGMKVIGFGDKRY
ncbi:hypothetical protein VRZ77_20460 [Ancylobacter sp. G4_0304]